MLALVSRHHQGDCCYTAAPFQNILLKAGRMDHWLTIPGPSPSLVVSGSVDARSRMESTLLSVLGKGMWLGPGKSEYRIPLATGIGIWPNQSQWFPMNLLLGLFEKETYWERGLSDSNLGGGRLEICHCVSTWNLRIKQIWSGNREAGSRWHLLNSWIKPYLKLETS